MMSRSIRLPLALVLLALLCGVAAAADLAIPVDRDGLPQWVPAQWNDFPVRLTVATREDLDALLARVPIASFSREQVSTVHTTPKDLHIVFQPRVTASEFDALVAAGYAPVKVRDLDREGREDAEQVWAQMAREGKSAALDTYPLTYYPTNDQIGTMLQTLASTYPDKAAYFTWGQSVAGRTLHGIHITDNVMTAEAEPEVRISSSMHGDEVVGLVLTLDFAYYLLENYGQAGHEDVTNLVDNYDITLMPSYNPDGTALDQRYNQNGVDLNRNFPLPAGTDPIQELENVNFMNFCNARHAVLSENYHGGSLVVNYPWDYTYTLAPDDAALIQMSLEYSTYNLPMYNGAFDHGITNGAAWYVVYGSLQDWCYDQTDDINVTIEVSNTKWPSAGTLAGFWNDNRESLMHWVKSARYGVNGVVTAADTGLPLAATVTVNGISTEVHTDPAAGDYYKLLPTGTYTITYEATGYVPQTLTGVATTWGTPTVQDVVMQPLAQGLVSGTVTDPSGQGLDALIEIRSWPQGELVDSVSSDAASGGAFSTSLFYGDYTFTASAPDHFTESQQVTIGATPATVDFVLGGMVTSYPVVEDFESGPGAFTGDWFVTDTTGHNSTHSMTDSEGNYASSTTTYCNLETSVNLVGVMDPAVSFYAKWSIENNWDAVFFEISTDGGSAWTALATTYTNAASGQGAQLPAGTPCFDGSQANWVYNVVDLTPYIGESDVSFRFRLSSDTSINYDGFYFDDFQIKIVTETGGETPVSDTPIAIAADVAAYPNPFNPQTTLKFMNPRAGHVQLAIFDLQGRHMRSLVDGEFAAGTHDVTWDGRGDDGRPAGSGIYLARLKADDSSASAKLMLVK